jgi:2',3'-cyclic-nucleotide 2'-phosphodiesterase (5'-nucleotidase family)
MKKAAPIVFGTLPGLARAARKSARSSNAQLLKYLALGAGLLYCSPSFAAGEAHTVRILFTNNSNGKLTDCGCRSDPFGGLAERVSFVREYRGKNPNALLLDSGGYLGLNDRDRKGPAVLRLMNLMGYDAWGAGDQELYRGLDRFVALLGDSRGKVVSASIKTSGRESPFAAYRYVTVDSIKIAITSIVSGETFAYSPKEGMDFLYDPPEAALARVLPIMRQNADYVIVLSQMGVKEDERIAAAVQGIDLIIGGHSQTLLEQELNVGGCRIVQAGKGGGRVGEIVVNFDNARLMKDFSYRLIEVGDAYKTPPDAQAILDSIK